MIEYIILFIYLYNCCEKIERSFSIFCKYKKCFHCQQKELYKNMKKFDKCDKKRGYFCDNIKECYYCHNRSFASNSKSRYWSDENKINPRFVGKNSHKKFKFNCDNSECGHEFESKLNAINYGTWCPYCCVPSKKKCTDKNCKSCFKKSFASHPKSKCWHSTKNGSIKPRDVALHSKSKYYFKCDKMECRHDFDISLDEVSRGNWCRYCANKALCLKTENCSICFNKSISSHPYGRSQWNHTLNFPILPEEVFKNSMEKYWFICNNKECNENFLCKPNHINYGRKCPHCKNKTEKMVYDWIKEEYNYNIEREKKFPWCVLGDYLRFDIFIQELNLIIEIDGQQHFVDIRHWNSSEYNRHRDIYKTILSLKNNISIIRICQDDIYQNKIDWKIELKNHIKQYNIPSINYISKNKKLYDKHKLLLCMKSEKFSNNILTIIIMYLNI